MDGRLALVTGASTGLGRAIAVGLADRGASVLAVSRPEGLGSSLVDELRGRSGNVAHAFLPADLSVQAQVRELAARVRSRHARLDVLVNNAGAFFPRRTLSVDGIEMTFALDHLAAVLLTLLLLDPLARAGGRVVTTASLAAGMGWIHRDVSLGRGYNGFYAYAQAKLASVLFTVELARRVPSLTPNAFDPGVVRTGLAKGISFLELCIRAAQLGWGVEPEVGARTALLLACDPLPPGATGGFWRGGRRVSLPRRARDARSAERLWDLSLELLGMGQDELEPLRRMAAAEPSRPLA